MRTTPEGLLLLVGLAACAARSEKSKEETTKVATDTLIETKRVVDTMVVQTQTRVKADTTVHTDTTIVADTTIAADTSKIGEGGVISVDTTKPR